MKNVVLDFGKNIDFRIGGNRWLWLSGLRHELKFFFGWWFVSIRWGKRIK